MKAVLNTYMKATLFILIFLVGQKAFTQTANTKLHHNDSFYVYYGIAGLGSNFGSFLPTLRVHNNKFTYTKEQNSYWGKKSKRKELISKGVLRQSSIDSILDILHELKDTTIYKTNPCIMSGGITYITVAHGTDTINFILDNTFDLIALKIIEIINPYLPKDKKLYGCIEDIREEEGCWKYLSNKVEQQLKDSINSIQ